MTRPYQRTRWEIVLTVLSGDFSISIGGDILTVSKSRNAGESPESRPASGKARLPLSSQLTRFTRRDLAILRCLYLARALSTRQIAAVFFHKRWTDLPERGLGTPCETRLRLLASERFGVIRIEPAFGGNLYGSSHSSAEPLTPWGRKVTLTGKGIQVLLRKGMVPEERFSDDGDPLPGYIKAHKLRPQGHDHAFVAAGAVLRAIGEKPEAFAWVPERDLAFALEREEDLAAQALQAQKPAPRFGLRPDALIRTKHMAFGIEADLGTIKPAVLASRFQKQVPIWIEAFHRGLAVPAEYEFPTAPLRGVLWYCTDTSPRKLHDRVYRLRDEACEKLASQYMPPGFSWYIDTYEALAWTFDHFLRPYALGLAPSPQAQLDAILTGALGQGAPVKGVATLGDIAAWQQVLSWAAQAKLHYTEYPLCIVLVRDRVEAYHLWRLVDRTDGKGRIAFVRANRPGNLSGPISHGQAASGDGGMDPAPDLTGALQRLDWCPDEHSDWETITMQEFLRQIP